MKKSILILSAVMLMAFITNAQSVAGKYLHEKGISTWEFIDQGAEEYHYKGYDKRGNIISAGVAFYSKKQEMVVVLFKRLDIADSVGFASCKVENGGIRVKTLNPDGSARWDGGLMKKK